MTLNQDALDLLREKYCVYKVETRYDPPGRLGTSDQDVTISASLMGFQRMLNDLFSIERATIDTRGVFSVSPMAITTDEKRVYVAKYPMREYPLDVIAAYGEKLRGALESEGCKVVLMPKELDVSVLTIEQLQQIRDDLTELINNLSYDNIIGF